MLLTSLILEEKVMEKRTRSPRWRREDFLPIVARIIEQRYRTSAKFVAVPEIKAHLLRNADALSLLTRDVLTKESYDIVAWFSACFTGCENGTKQFDKWKPLMDRFKRTGTTGSFAYRPALSQDALVFPDEVEEAINFREGATRKVLVNVYERDPNARRECLKRYGTRCSVCTLSFGEKYGTDFETAIHVHHLRPLSEIGKAYVVNPIRDLRPVCPNCHAVLHRRVPPYTIEEVRSFLRQ